MSKQIDVVVFGKNALPGATGTDPFAQRHAAQHPACGGILAGRGEYHVCLPGLQRTDVDPDLAYDRRLLVL